MDTGIYVALSREIGIFRDMEATANDIANIGTTGYQSEGMLFSDYLMPGTQQEGHVAFANDAANYRDTAQGSLQTTANPLDAAIEGKGYFVVQTPLGIRYTRNGNFKTNSDGVMVTADGYPVMDEDGSPITFDPTDRVIEIRDDGTINVDASPRTTLKIVQFDNEQLLKHVGNNLLSSDSAPKPAENFKVAAGTLERSNVNPFLAMTHLLYITRTATDTANFINTIYTLERNASNTLAKNYS